MHPSASVILFTTLAGAGYGLLALVALATLRGEPVGAALRVGIVVALAAIAGGLLASLAHLGQPRRAWRAFSQWRSSWLSREGVAAVVTFLPATALAAALWLSSAAALRLPAAAGAVLGAAITVACTAQIYATLRTIRAWHSPLTLPSYLVFALWTGAVAFAAIAAASGEDSLRGAAAGTAVVASVAVLGLKRAHWRRLDALPVADAGRATGLAGFGTVTAFEAPHTEENFLLREMGFALARRHAARLRRLFFGSTALALVLSALAAFGVAGGGAPALLALPVAAVAVAVERWLFFAEARHVVMAYYGR